MDGSPDVSEMGEMEATAARVSSLVLPLVPSCSSCYSVSPRTLKVWKARPTHFGRVGDSLHVAVLATHLQ